MAKTGPKGPHYNLTEPQRDFRWKLLRYLSATRRQLLHAYLSGDPQRIATAKLRLSKLLSEMAESPELGPTIPFRWGHRLETLIRYGIDEDLSPADFNTHNWHGLATKLKLQAEATILKEIPVEMQV